MTKEEDKELPKMSKSAIMSTSEIPDPEKPDRMPKFERGQIVYFVSDAGHTDDLVSYSCVGKGKITDIRGRFSWENPGIYYEMEDSCYVEVEEAFVFTDPLEAIKVLDAIYANEDLEYPRGWYT